MKKIKNGEVYIWNHRYHLSKKVYIHISKRKEKLNMAAYMQDTAS